ncbi:hypothetical protein I302_100864 [Kwoniella bestiolae CBS 10118]|uniref:Uncharacterized protein n=1 Tax=Kwoniella bestiolae CBS 10118 TaxID=1296100 RepID=A0A1B9G6C4_9TREE|nr:hypothetical protein I302_04237 [Kwoniella bestiolae CBS 10118]OCF26551.1 hypothetical protein I302_04237 [Kwoniella bestiolae CBS 10118]
MSDTYGTPFNAHGSRYGFNDSVKGGHRGGWGSDIGNHKPSQPFTTVSDQLTATPSQAMVVHQETPVSHTPAGCFPQGPAHDQGSHYGTSPVPSQHYGQPPSTDFNSGYPPAQAPQGNYDYAAAQFYASAQTSTHGGHVGQPYPQGPLPQHPPSGHVPWQSGRPSYPTGGLPHSNSNYSDNPSHDQGQLTPYGTSNNSQLNLMVPNQYGQPNGVPSPTLQSGQQGIHQSYSTETKLSVAYDQHQGQVVSYPPQCNPLYGETPLAQSAPQSSTSSHVQVQASYGRKEHHYTPSPNQYHVPPVHAGQQSHSTSLSQSDTSLQVSGGYQHNTYHGEQQAGNSSGKRRKWGLKFNASVEFDYENSSRSIDSQSFDENVGHSPNSGGTADELYRGN